MIHRIDFVDRYSFVPRFPIVLGSGISIVTEHSIVEQVCQEELEWDVEQIEHVTEGVTQAVEASTFQFCHLKCTVLDLFGPSLIYVASQMEILDDAMNHHALCLLPNEQWYSKEECLYVEQDRAEFVPGIEDLLCRISLSNRYSRVKNGRPRHGDAGLPILPLFSVVIAVVFNRLVFHRNVHGVRFSVEAEVVDGVVPAGLVVIDGVDTFDRILAGFVCEKGCGKQK